MTVKGKIKHVDVSGGFWGIETDEGLRFQPVAPLPKAFQKEGIRVSADIKPTDEFTIYMWGVSVDVRKIEKV